MELKIQQVQQRLIKRYFIVNENASIIIDEEYEFIEECLHAQMSVEEVAQELINIYMVA
jgi:hypothetical protein